MLHVDIDLEEKTKDFFIFFIEVFCFPLFVPLLFQIVQFIVTLVQNNRLVSLKRKQPLLLNTKSSPKGTILQTMVKETGEDSCHVPLRTEVLDRGEISDDIVIYDITDNMEEESEKSCPTPENPDNLSPEMINGDHLSDIVIVEDDSEDEDDPVVQADRIADSIGPLSPVREDVSSPLMSGPLLLNNQSSLNTEDPVTMMDSILNESGVISQNINLLGKVELIDYLDSIDCTLEDFKALLSGRQFSIDRDLLVDLETKGMEPFRNSEAFPESVNSTLDSRKSDQQLVQYTTYPLMAFLDGDSGNFISDTQNSKTNETDNLLESSLDSQPTQSKLVRLEPLTEAEANEATLFYLCELDPAPLDSDMPLLDN
ncbi:hypothetical protein GDO81_008126 [Engystomops pustulosus]|uniref:Vertebrate heat shock transcription factor C-terminal domain-containing protein n=1 Tax=Engystomops pustulosus TaxID=76066 RepID=A0AAV7CD70_ENGPU|nr:hypothetical protein GDO81_008126 [Engystomops pustulosus]